MDGEDLQQYLPPPPPPPIQVGDKMTEMDGAEHIHTYTGQACFGRRERLEGGAVRARAQQTRTTPTPIHQAHNRHVSNTLSASQNAGGAPAALRIVSSLERNAVCVVGLAHPTAAGLSRHDQNETRPAKNERRVEKGASATRQSRQKTGVLPPTRSAPAAPTIERGSPPPHTFLPRVETASTPTRPCRRASAK